MKKILFTTPILEHPPAGGPFLRIENSIKALNKISELHIVSRVKKKDIGGQKAEDFYKKLCFKFTYLKLPRKNIISRLTYFFKNFSPHFIKAKNDADFIVKYARQNKIEIIWFGFGNISYDLIKKVKEIAPDLKLICDTDSVWSRFVLRGLPFIKDENKKLQIQKEGQAKEKEEADWVNFCDVTTAVSNVDADYYKSLTVHKDRVKLFSNVIDIENYKNHFSKPQNFSSPAIYFAGYFGKGSPTDIAARFVINEVLPLVKKSIPEIHFYIIGKDSKETLSDINDSNISVIGQVDSVLPYLCNADVALVPLFFESGTRFKILEAGACAVPMVSTTLGAEGIDVEDQKDIIIADDAQKFADGIIKLIQDKNFAKTIADNCKSLIIANFSVEKHAQEAQEILDYLYDRKNNS